MSQAGRNNDTVGPTSGAILFLEGDTGGDVPPDVSGVIHVIGGSGVTVAGNIGTNTLTISSVGGGLTWTVVTGTTQAAAVNNGYIANNAGLVTVTLPAVSAVGDIVAVTGINNATGWRIAQNAGNQIFFGISSTTLGAGGSLSSTATRDVIFLVCVVANGAWNVIQSIGNITVV